MNNQEVKTVVDTLLATHRGYAQVHRKINTRERYITVVDQKLLQQIDIHNQLLREPLIEHVGHLPILATALYPHLEHYADIDIGRVLTMLAIHDIGEIKTGDYFGFSKTPQQAQDETDAALNLLDPMYHTLFLEYEHRESLDARFAKAVDSISPIVHEIDFPELNSQRFHAFNIDVNWIREKKTPHFSWDSHLVLIFEELLQRY